MSFGQPLWFWAFLLLLPLAALFVRNERQRSMLLRRLVAARLEAQLAGSVSLVRRRLRFAILLLALACIILSLAQPRWGYIWEEHKTHGRDVLIAIDCSKSMLANDIEPSRLARAKLAAEDLIAQLGGDRVGLVAFAGTAFLQAPLTADHDDVLTALHELDTDIIPRGGTDIAEAIRTAVDAFGKGESDDRALILFTDGEELEESGLDAARELKGAVRIFTVGLGSAEGAVLTYPGANGETEYVKDPDGQVVKSRLDESRLREIAQATNGFYVHLLSGPAEMQQIFRDGLQPMTEHDLDSQYSRRPIERYQWPLAAGMVLLAGSLLIGERKRKPAPRAGAAPAVAAGLLLLAAWPGAALGKNDGLEAYEREDYKGALDSFDLQLKKRPENDALNFDAGSAAYKAGDLDRAMEGFSSAVTSTAPALREKAEYNLGNTLFQRGVKLKEKPAELTELRNSLQHYDAALKVQPKDADAQFNRDLVKNLIAELEKEPPKQDQQQQNKDQQKKDQQKDQKDQQNQNQQGQKQDQQQNKDQQSKDQQSQPQQGQGQKQDQQNSGAGGQQKDQQDQQSGQKDSQQQQQQQGKQGGQQKDQKQGDSKDQQSKAGEQKDKNENGQPQEPKDGKDPQNAEQQPQPASAGQDQQQPQRKLSGEMKDAGQQPKEGEQQSAEQQAEQQAAEEARAAAEDRMTEEQARNLLNSLKTDDRRVRLLNPKGRKDISGNYRDW